MLVPGRHRGHVRRQGDKDPGGGGPGPPGIDVDHHRNFGVADALDDLAHGAFQAAGGVQLDHQGFGVLALRLANAFHDEFREARVDGTHRPQHVNRPGRDRPGRQARQERHRQHREAILKLLHGQPDTP